MARPNRTERAEARRRYRAAVQGQSGEGAEPEMEDEAPAGQASNSGPARARGTQVLQPDPGPQTRPVGFFGAFKAAYRPVHYRDDLRTFIPLITKTNAIWPVVALCAIGLGILLIRRDPHDFLFQMTISIVITPLPMMPAMIAGFLAPRATWLAGIIAAFISSMATVAYWASGAMPTVVNGNVVGYAAIPAAQLGSDTIQLLWLALPAGALLAALAGWYKRFLAMTGPAAQMAKRDGERAQAARRRQTAPRNSTPPTSSH